MLVRSNDNRLGNNFVIRGVAEVFIDVYRLLVPTSSHVLLFLSPSSDVSTCNIKMIAV